MARKKMEVEKEAPPSLLVALLSVHLLPCPPPDLATTVAVEKAGSEGKVEVEVKAVALLPSPSSSLASPCASLSAARSGNDGFLGSFLLFHLIL